MKKILQFILVIFVIALISSISIEIVGPDDEINYSMGDSFIMEDTEFNYAGPQIFWHSIGIRFQDFRLPSASLLEITESDIGKLIYYQISFPTLVTKDRYDRIEIKYSPTPSGIAGRYNNKFIARMGDSDLQGTYNYMLNSGTIQLRNNWDENEEDFRSAFDSTDDISYSIINSAEVFSYKYKLIRPNKIYEDSTDRIEGNFTDEVTYEYDKASGVINYIEYDITNTIAGVSVHLLYTRV